MGRKLASIARISEIKPIINADKIEVVLLCQMGWELVAKRDEFAVGDLAVFVEIDSLLPERPEFEFMRERKFRVRTVKMKGQVSQGILFPLSILPTNKVFQEGDDVTDILGIKNYQDLIEIKDPTTNVSNKPKSKLIYFLMKYKFTRTLGRLLLRFAKVDKDNFPSFCKKSDEERIQNDTHFLERCEGWEEGNNVVITEKLDGSSATYFVKKNKLWGKTFGVCSRNWWLKTPQDCYWWEMARKYELEKKLKGLRVDIYIQGELAGPSIQKNKYRLTERKLFLFNAYDISNNSYYFYDELAELARYLGCEVVPLLEYEMSKINKDTTVPELVALSKGKSKLCESALREGIVIREERERQKRSAKVINPEFSLKED